MTVTVNAKGEPMTARATRSDDAEVRACDRRTDGAGGPPPSSKVQAQPPGHVPISTQGTLFERRRRWVEGGAALLVAPVAVIAWLAERPNVPRLAIAALVAVAAIVAVAGSRVTSAGVTARSTWRKSFAAMDVILVSALLLAFGASSLAILYAVAPLTLATKGARPLAATVGALSAIGFALAIWGHATLIAGVAPDVARIAFGAIVIQLVAWWLVQAPADAAARVQSMRTTLTAALGRSDDATEGREQGKGLDACAQVEAAQSVLLTRLVAAEARAAETAVAAQASADQVTALTRELAESHRERGEAARTHQAALEEHRTALAASALRADSAAADATRLGARITAVAAEAHALAEVSAVARRAANRAAGALGGAAERIGSAGRAVALLSEEVERVATLADAVARVARQTNRLALNASIEAARVGEQSELAIVAEGDDINEGEGGGGRGGGFGVVADEIRELAGESSRAARALTAAVARVRGSAAEAARLIDAGSAAAGEAGVLAGEAAAMRAPSYDLPNGEKSRRVS